MLHHGVSVGSWNRCCPSCQLQDEIGRIGSIKKDAPDSRDEGLLTRTLFVQSMELQAHQTIRAALA